MRGTRRGERHHDVGARIETVVAAEDVRRRTRGQVDGDHRGAHEINGADGSFGHASHGRLHSGAQHGVDDQLGVAESAIHFRLDIGGGAQNDGLYWQPREHVGGIALKFLGSPAEQHLDDASLLVEFARGHKAVAAVVPPAADDRDPSQVRIHQVHDLGYRRAGVLHQPQRGHVVLLRAQPVDRAHLFRGGDLHQALAPAMVSMRRNCSGGPMTIRKSPASILSCEDGL